MNPKVSIYIPTKNRLELLQAAINSVLEQTYTNWELIVVNDASTDSTQTYLTDLISKNPKIKAIHNTVSQGACVCRNAAIFSAEGEFVTGLDDDDEFTPDRLQVFLDNWDEANEDVVALCTYKDYMIRGQLYKEKKLIPHLISADMILYKNMIGNQIFVKTSVLRDLGGFDVDFRMWQDYNTWYKLLRKKNWKIKKLPISTYIWENTPREDRITQKDKQKTKDTYELFVKKNKLSFKQANILKFSLINYGLKEYSFAFCLEMIFGTLFDQKTIRILRTNFIHPTIANAFKRNKNK